MKELKFHDLLIIIFANIPLNDEYYFVKLPS